MKYVCVHFKIIKILNYNQSYKIIFESSFYQKTYVHNTYTRVQYKTDSFFYLFKI